MNAVKFARYIANMDASKRFLLLHHGRCGSTMLWTALNKHRDMQWFGEVFDPSSQPQTCVGHSYLRRLRRVWGSDNGGFSYMTGGHPQGIRSKLRADLCGVSFARYDRKTPECENMLVNTRDFVWPIVLQLYSRGLKIILLRRRNMLAKMVSSRFAERNQLWHITRSKDLKAVQQSRAITIDPAEVERIVTCLQQQFARYLDYFGNALVLDYEDLAQWPQQTFARVQEFLGVPVCKLTPGTRKNPKPWQARVANYDELKKHLQYKAGFEQWFR